MRSGSMPIKKFRLAIAVGFSVALLAQAPETYKARLSPVPIDAQTRANIAGIGSATATLVGSKLSITGSYEGLLSPATSPRFIRDR